MDINSRRKMRAILRILGEADKPLGSASIASELQLMGLPLKERMVRYYLVKTDDLGLTENLGRTGHRITSQGIDELRTAGAVEKVGYVSARVDELSYRMSFDLSNRTGTVVLNVSRIRLSEFNQAQRLINLTLDAGFGMGRLIAVAQRGEVFGCHRIGPGEIAVGTVCSVTLNGVLRAAGIPVISRFGGLLELRGGRPFRFSQIVHYDGTTIDPVEIFLKGKMMRVRQAALQGSGTVGAGFREIPAAARATAEKLTAELSKIGLLGGLFILGRPGQPLLDIPVSPGRVGLIVAAGLNPIAAVEEAGIETENYAMATLHPFDDLIPARDLSALRSAFDRPSRSPSPSPGKD